MADPNFYIDSPRLVLTHLNSSLDSHCDLFLAVTNAPEVRKGTGGLALNLADREAARKNNADDRESMNILSTGYGRYVISLKPTPPPPPPPSEPAHAPPYTPAYLESLTKIGILSMKLRLQPGAPSLPDIGFAMLTPFSGKGYATEAATALIRYFRDVRGQTRFFGYCDPLNQRSMAMFRRLGWEDRGVRDVKGLARDGRVVRGNVWSLGVEGGLDEFGLPLGDGGGRESGLE